MMRSNHRSLGFVVATLVMWMCAGFVPGAAQGASTDEPAANSWSRAEDRTAVDVYSRPVYVPETGCFYQWNLPSKTVRRFDPATQTWQTEKPTNADLPEKAINAVIRQEKLNWRQARLLRNQHKGYQSTMNGAVWDSKRKQIVYCLNRCMLAYDPATKTWTDLGAKSIINGREYPGSPPVFGSGACYDPVNDEIVLFPHWTFHSRDGRHAPKNLDRVDVDGRVSNHLGTLRYSFKDNTWRRVADTFGSPEVRNARKELFAAMKQLSDASDQAGALRLGRKTPEPDAVIDALKAAADALAGIEPPPEAAKPVERAVAEAKAAVDKAAQQQWHEAVLAAGRALWTLNEDVIDGALRVEPPARCGAPMVYIPEKKWIVMFGGRNGLTRHDLKTPHHFGLPPGALNDTWIYDCTTRQWRELDCDRRPPEIDRPALVYVPAQQSLCVVDIDWNKGRKPPHEFTVWSLNLDGRSWAKHVAGKWPWPISREGVTGSSNWLYEVGFDPKRSLLFAAQNTGKGKTYRGETYVMTLDLAAEPTAPAPEWKAPPPLKPQIVPSDDPAWIAKLKELPANTWVAAKPPSRPSGRAWSNVGYDPVRGHLYYFGGGHSTYQATDVAVYVVGANKWVYAAGDHNDFIPPEGWDGASMGYRGSKPAHHQRNQYTASDGRMFVSAPDLPGYVWFYDLDRGGVWRFQKIAKVTKDEKALVRVQSPSHLGTDDGRVIELHGRIKTSSSPPDIRDRALVSIYDLYTRELTVTSHTGPSPGYVYEHRPFCFMPDKNQVFFYQHLDSKKFVSQQTWAYDIEKNTWTNLKPKTNPTQLAGSVTLTEYVPDQNAVFCVVLTRDGQKRANEYWVYSFDRNAWACMTKAGSSFSWPYGQGAYVAKYGVLVNVPSMAVMRLDISKLDWK